MRLWQITIQATNMVAALFRLENSRAPEDIANVVAALIEWLRIPDQADLRRAFVGWLRQVLLPRRIPGAEMPEIENLQEVRTMLAERVRPGGLIVAHNMNEAHADPRYVKAITTNPDLETVFLNLQTSGIGVTMKKR